MAQLVECFLITYAALGLASSHKLGVVAHAYKPVLFIPVLGRKIKSSRSMVNSGPFLGYMNSCLEKRKKKEKKTS